MQGPVMPCFGQVWTMCRTETKLAVCGCRLGRGAGYWTGWGAIRERHLLRLLHRAQVHWKRLCEAPAALVSLILCQWLAPTCCALAVPALNYDSSAAAHRLCAI